MNPGDPLPDGWRWTTLGECCTQERTAITSDKPEYAEMPYLGLEHIEGNTGRILVSETAAREAESTSNNFCFTPEHVLYGKLRPYLNKVALPEFSGRCSTEIIPLRPVDMDRGFLAWFLRRSDTVEYAMQGKTGSRMPRASMKELLLLPIPLPPLAEQRRIVAALETRLAAAERARRAALSQLNALEAMPAALLRKVFERAATIKSWRRVEISEICEVVMGQSPPSETYRSTPEGLPFFQGKADFGQENPTARIWCVEPRKIALPGDILISVRAPVGPTNIADVECCIGRGLAAIRSLGDVDLDFVHYFLKASESDIAAIGTGSTFQAISGKQLRALSVPLPPIDEQREIVAALEREMAATERARTAARERLALAEALPGAILRRAFAPGAPA